MLRVTVDVWIDRQSEVFALLQNHVQGVFDRFDDIDIEKNHVYIVGRLEMARCCNLIRQRINEQHAKIIFSNPAEGSQSLLDQFDRLKIRDLVFDRRIAVLGGGAIESGPLHFCHENFLFLTSIVPQNIDAIKYTSDIYAKSDKPYKFLFLNGRLRSHRKWLIESFRRSDILDHGLWSCLQRNTGNRRRDLTLMIGGEDLMFVPERTKLLPKQYELKTFHDRYTHAEQANWAKPLLFGTDHWYDAVINVRCYTDTYFSIVTETVFEYPHSFRTEKIWKPIMMGHPWIACANRGYYQDLRNLGFQTFDDLIDESFDHIDHNQDRIQRLHDVVVDLCNQDLDSFMRSCQDICKYNQQHYFELAQEVGSSFASKFLRFIHQLDFVHERS